MTTTKKRVAAFDVLKGIAIYLVVMGHVLTMCIRDIDSAVLFKLVGEIHMPIFFFISGYFTYKLTGNGDLAMPNLRKRFRQLIIPFLAVSALWMWYFPHSRLQSPLSQSWPQLLTTYWKDGYWFTLTLFEVVLVYAGISRLMAAARRLWMQVAIPAAAYLALILVSPLISDPAANFDPVGIGLLTQFFPVFMMGVFARKYSDAFRRMATQPWVATAAAVAAFGTWYYSVYTWEFPALPAWCQFVAQPVLHASLMTVVFVCLDAHRTLADSSRQRESRHLPAPLLFPLPSHTASGAYAHAWAHVYAVGDGVGVFRFLHHSCSAWSQLGDREKQSVGIPFDW